MDIVIEHDGAIYEIHTTPQDRMFATVEKLRPRRASGVIARFLEESTGETQYTYDAVVMEDGELIELVMELGHKFSRARAWKNLFDWAYFKTRKSNHIDD